MQIIRISPELNKLSLVTVALLLHLAAHASVVVSPWVTLFQGIDHAVGTNFADATYPRRQVVHCLRVDLTDPDLQLFTSPHCTNNCGAETLGTTTSLFLQEYKLQVAVNGNFFSPTDGALGAPEDVLGLSISEGKVVSPATSSAHAAVLLFATNNQAIFVPTNWPPTKTLGIFTAFAGNIALVVKGKNFGSTSTFPSDIDPRTAAGLSQDRRYLYLITIDGRQSGYSDGATGFETGEWLIRFGSYDGLNLDGGGSATMAMADCSGNAVRLNKPSYVAAYGRERTVGHNIGIYAKPAPSMIRDLTVVPGDTTTILTWRTDSAATTQVEYGLTSSYGNFTPLDPTPVQTHIATVSGLSPGKTYFFRVISRTGNEDYASGCRFSTTNATSASPLFGLTKTWKYTTTNLDGVEWTTRGYGEPGWLGPGAGLLYVETSALVGPKNTPLPTGSGLQLPPTYYFRTKFNFPGDPAGVSLVFSNYVDDGAVFYLNGVEIARLRMAAAPTAILNSSLATAFPCAGVANQGDANNTCPDVFTVSGDAVTNLVSGENVLAVEVHNYTVGSPDIVFGSALGYSRPAELEPQLNVFYSGDEATLFWNGSGFALQRQAQLSASPNTWEDVPGTVVSPFKTRNEGTMFYRLKK